MQGMSGMSLLRPASSLVVPWFKYFFSSILLCVIRVWLFSVLYIFQHNQKWGVGVGPQLG